MPTYEYICDACGHEFEQFQRMSEDSLRDCPSCGLSKLRRKIGTGAGIIFKGGGFYETDFKDKKKPPTAEKPKKESSDSSKGSSGEAKSSVKKESKAASS